jgi:hypothetical protein
MEREQWAEDLAITLLEDNERRLSHTRAVANRASLLGTALLAGPAERSVVVEAAWLHDIGYSPPLALTGAHHLDGARYLADLGETRLACLVAHHGSGEAESGLRGFATEFSEFPAEHSLVADILTYSDLTSGPDGSQLTLDDRLREIRSRYGDDNVVVRGLDDSEGLIREAFARVESALQERSDDAKITR